MRQTSTTTWEEVIVERDAHGNLTGTERILFRGFAFHCTCSLTNTGFDTRRSAQLAARQHRAECAGGSEPLPHSRKATR